MPPSIELPELDPFVEEFQQFPFATLALLRERAPVQPPRPHPASVSASVSTGIRSTPMGTGATRYPIAPLPHCAVQQAWR